MPTEYHELTPMTGEQLIALVRDKDSLITDLEATIKKLEVTINELRTEVDYFSGC